MALTLGTTGMDSATEAELHAAFKLANAGTGGHWQLLGENDADYVVVDMDSMYGPMSWLRLHAAGKKVIGLTSASRTQTDYHLVRPVQADDVVALLREIAAENGITPAVAATPAAPPPPVVGPPVPKGMSPAPMPQDQLPEEHPQAVDEEAEPPSPAPALPASVEAGTLAPTTIQPAPPVHAPPVPAFDPEPPHAFEPEPEFVPTPERPAPRVPQTLADWLEAGHLPGRTRFSRPAGPTLLIDPATRQYFGPSALKPLLRYFEGTVEQAEFEPANPATWPVETAALGAPQPLARLQWYGALLAGKGAILPGYDADGMFKLGKWPQTEREFPKHFRIATAMMKGPATLDEITAASGVPREEVADFINASLVTGFAEPYREPEPEPEAPKPSGLFGRFRGK